MVKLKIIDDSDCIPNSGISCWYDGAVGGFDGIQQVINTISGHSYRITFFLSADRWCDAQADSTDPVPDMNNINPEVSEVLVYAGSLPGGFTVTPSSNDASLNSVAAQTCSSPTGGDGTTTGTPVDWSINVDNSKSSIGLSDIAVPSDESVNLYSDSSFSSEITGSNTISLAEGGATKVYVMVTAQDGATKLYYEVTVNRAAPPATVAAAPTAVSATAGNGQATVSFTAPTNNGGSAITGYKVYVYKDGVKQNSLTTSGTSSPITVTGLTNGTAYTFKVVATNSVGDSSESTESSAVTPVAATVAAAPTAVSATAGNGQATVSFTAPTNNGGSAITGYKVYVYKDGVKQNSLTTSGTSSPITVTGLTNCTGYTFTVTAINSQGESTESTASSKIYPVDPNLYVTTGNQSDVVEGRTSILAVEGNSGSLVINSGGSTIDVPDSAIDTTGLDAGDYVKITQTNLPQGTSNLLFKTEWMECLLVAAV